MIVLTVCMVSTADYSCYISSTTTHVVFGSLFLESQ